VVNDRGRNFEPGLLVRYWFKTNPLAMLSSGPLGLKLLMRGRLPVTGERIEGREQLRAIIAKASEMGGE
jgi:hypothetical protein